MEGKDFYRSLRVIVTKKLNASDVIPIINEFIKKKIFFGLSKYGKRYQIWREPFSDELEYSKYKNYDSKMNEIIETDKALLEERNFIRVWKNGKLIYTTPKARNTHL